MNLNELEGLLQPNGSRFRVICQLVELESSKGRINVMLGTLPDFRRNNEDKTLRAIIGSEVYQSTFVDPSKRVPQRGDAVSVWLVVYALEEERNWEVLDLKAITTKELERLRMFWESPWGHDFRTLSNTSSRGVVDGED